MSDEKRALLEQALTAVTVALNRAQTAERRVARLEGLLRRFVNGINDRRNPLFIRNKTMALAYIVLLEEAQAVLGAGDVSAESSETARNAHGEGEK